ncbi:MAG: helix-turn-helix transcriptional regulator [Ruminococcaceae bacterium]|nr:helix-turn-helix transcriptional regulator [Oscillospiraceae bacterium]
MDSSLSENIKYLRVQNGLNQVDLAKRLNVTKQCVSNWENDNVLPSVSMLNQIADFFGVSTDRLLGREAGERLDLSGLSDEQITHIRLLVKDLRAANRK